MTETLFEWRVILFVLLAIAAISDVSRYRIPNWIPLSIVISLIIILIAMSAEHHVFLASAISGLIGLGVGCILFRLRLMGGGDGKLFAACAAWFNSGALLAVAFFIAVAGVCLSLLYLGVRSLQPAVSTESGKASFRSALKSRVPYGVAIAVGVVAASIFPDIANVSQLGS